MMQIKEGMTTTDDFVQYAAALKRVSSELERLRTISISLQTLIGDTLEDNIKINNSAELQSIDLLTQSLLDLRDVVSLIAIQCDGQDIKKSEIVSIVRLRELSDRLIAETGEKPIMDTSPGNLSLL